MKQLLRKPSTRCCIGLVGALLLSPGCRSARQDKPAQPAKQVRIGATSGSKQGDGRVRRVVTMFDQRPWLNADSAADRDPEGVRYKVFLDTGGDRARYVDGTFHIEIYQLDPRPEGGYDRALISDYHYPASTFVPVRANILGDGYHLKLHWAKKDVAGHEIEIITTFEDADGNKARSDTKRLRVPKYVS
jgi:hypothetical protein